MKLLKVKKFANGNLFLLQTNDGFLVETTDTFLPIETRHQVKTSFTNGYGSRKERWIIGVSVMSGCPIHCKFCATGKLKKYRNLTSKEIIEQVEFCVNYNPTFTFSKALEHKINYTRMGEPFLNVESIKSTVERLDLYCPAIHHYISTIGIKNSDFSWIKDNITLQLSLHSLDEERRNNLIPYSNKMTIKELGEVRTKSNLKTTLNLTLVNEDDFNIDKLEQFFSKEHFFIKLSPINKNVISDKNKLGKGLICL